MTSSHYNDVTMSATASQITDFSIVCSTVGSGADQPRKTSKFRVTGLCAGKSPVTGKFPTKKASNAENVSIWWRHHVVNIYGSTLAQAMAWCRAIPSLTAPSHYLNQCWLIAKCVLWHSSEKRFTRCAHEMSRNMCSGTILSKSILQLSGAIS